MSADDGLRRIAVVVQPEGAEAAGARLHELAPGGLEEASVPEGVELAIYGAAALEQAVIALFPGASATVVADGWEDAWRAFHRPVVVGGVWIGPPWETAPPDTPSVTIDPGRAFGTGAHPTTRLSLELLATLPAGSLLDVGCGSGVLAIAAARLGFGPVRGVDDDPVAVEVALENAGANGVSLEAWVADARVDTLPETDVATVNILLPAVESVVPRLRAGAAVTSGYLAAAHPSIPGWRSIARRETDGWAADILVPSG